MISSADKNDYPILIKVWESAVRATHDFLSDEDFEFYKAHIPIYFKHVSLYKYQDDNGEIKRVYSPILSNSSKLMKTTEADRD